MKRLLRWSVFAAAQLLAAKDFTVTLLHVNDTHDRIEPIQIQGKPYGGMTRLGTLVDRYRQSDPNVLFLHAGDAFQGTYYFNVYEGLADLVFLNALHVDAMAVGNHEFDKGNDALATFASNAVFPLLAANLDVDKETSLKGHIQPSVVFTRGGQKIGVIGVTIPNLPEMSFLSPNIHMRDLTSSVQAEVDALTKSGVNKVILLTHMGYPAEQDFAKTLHGVDVIVGGHTHTLLGTTTAPGWAKSSGPYPTVVENADGGKTLVVQAWEGARVLGRLQVTFDGAGRVKKWSNTQPIAVDESVPEKTELKAMVAAFQKPIAQQFARKVGTATETIVKGPQLGEFVTDAMLAATAKQNVVVALMNPAGIRTSVDKGDVTFGSAMAVQPFGNTLVVMDVTGAELKEALEDMVRGVFTEGLWVSAGTTYTLDLTKPRGSRIYDVTIGGKPLDPAATYRICVNNYMASGGDGMNALKNAKGFRQDTGLVDLNVFVDYLGAHSPVNVATEGRVRFIRN